jgi:hypothetical protein
MSAVWPYLAAILPTILVAVLFYFLIKSMLEGDRRERLAQKQFEAEQDRSADAGERAAERATAPRPAARGGDDGATGGSTDMPGNSSPHS